MGPERNLKSFNPFPGLRPFLPEESDLFFGREGESEEVLRKLLKNRFVTVMGASGTGKSSLIYCGVIPRVKKLSESGTGWKILTFRPGNDPIGNLAEIIVQTVNPNDKRESVKHEISSALLANPDALSVLVKNLIIRNNEKVLFLVDQFEELFRYSMSGAGSVPGRNAITFVSLLENAVTQRNVEIYSIITMRSDFIGECAHFHGFTQLVNSSNYLVPHMNRDNYRAAIEGPVKFAGATIDPKLVETLLEDIGDQTDQLPVLQHALMRTWSYWEELDDRGRPVSFSEYDAVGTMSDAMSRHANEAFEELSPGGKELCEKLFRTITEKGADNKGIRHPSKVSTIKKIIGCSSEELFDVIGKFRSTSRSFLTPRENIPLDDDSVIDVSHESLMRLWDRLKQWVDDEAASVQMYLRLSEASAMYQQGKTTLWRPPDLQLAINWREQHKPTLQWAERYDPAFERAMVYLRTSEKEYQAEEENKIRLQKRQIRRAKIIAMILGSAALISIGFMLFAFVQQIAADRARNEADESARQARYQSHLADSNKTVAEQRKIEADLSAQLARDNEALAKQNEAEAIREKARAEKNEALATEESIRANKEADSAKVAKVRAETNAEEARKQEKIATTRRMLTIGKQLSIKSLQLDGQKDLQTLLAYQAYIYNSRYGGQSNDADIYQGLYNVARQYGSENFKKLEGHNGQITSIAFIPGKREFYSSAYDGKVLKWSLDNKDQSIQVVYQGTEIIEILAVSPDANWLACGGNNAVIRIIPVKGGNSFELKGHSGEVKSLLFSFDGKYLYSAALDGKVLKWDLAAKTSISINPGQSRINYIDISSGGKYLAGITNDGKAIVWEPEKESDVFRIPETNETGKIIRVVRFRPKDNTLAVGYTDGNVELYDIASRKRISVIKAHSGELTDIRFNSKLNQMATASKDRTLKIWDTEDLTTPPITFNDHGLDEFVLVIEFSPDGQMIVSGTYDPTDNLTGRPTKAEMLTPDICNLVSRNLNGDEWKVYVGGDIPYEKTCADKEWNIKVNPIR